MCERRVVVVGGGVIGVCCAYFLARRGARVTLLERDEIGRAASFGNAGCIAPGHAPLNTPSRKKGVFRQLLDPCSPLHIPPRCDLALARWLWTFRKNCTHARMEEGMRALAPLGHATLELFDRLVDEEGIDCGYRRDGYYEVCRTATRLEAVRREAKTMAAFGFRAEPVEADALRELEPVFRAPAPEAVYYPDAASCDPYRFVLGLAKGAGRHGATFRTGQAVKRVEVRGGEARGVRLETGEIVEADEVVIATGAYSLRLAADLGARLPIQAGKGYHRDLDSGVEGTPALRITCVLSEASVFCTPMEGFVRFAGTLELSGLNHELREPRLEQLTAAAGQYLEGMGAAEPTSEWCGLRPCTPDGLPIVGPVHGVDGLYVATGHAMLGLTLGPITGRLMAEHILDGEPSIEIGALAVDRF
jgi:D-amino-acid dehydrogenase